MACALVSLFARMEDPRGFRGRRHLLSDILAIAILASICGASGFADIALFGESKEKWLRTFLELPSGVPSAATFARVFRILNPDAFEACFRLWWREWPDGSSGCWRSTARRCAAAWTGRAGRPRSTR